MVLLSAFEAVLHRYSGQKDLVVGSPLAGRSRPETQGLIGYLASTIVLRARFDDRLTFAGLLAQTKESALRTYEHQLLPAERLVRELRDSRPSEGLFDVMFVLPDTRVPTLSLRDVRVEPLASEIRSLEMQLTTDQSRT